ncbi:MAG: YccF domain-containing protein [Prolixibacteraceae bacterium]|nr:YccF domain-containing protein [Prolixibacteraceae bacterium]
MSTLGNILWIILGGFIIALEYLVSGILMMITIVGIPFGIQAFKMAELALWPFGREIRQNAFASGCLGTLMNLIWIIIGGFWIFLTHLFLGVLLSITIIGIPFGRQHFKLAALALTPFGHDVAKK